MTTKHNETPLSNLQKAWDLSRPNLGSAEYLSGEEPNCIIAHLYILEGGKLEDMKVWCNTGIYPMYDRIPLLHKYGCDFLTDLQESFDTGNEKWVDSLIASMSDSVR